MKEFPKIIRYHRLRFNKLEIFQVPNYHHTFPATLKSGLIYKR